MALTIFRNPIGHRGPLLSPNSLAQPSAETRQGLLRIAQRKCHHSWNEVQANEGLSSFLSVSVHLNRGATGS